MSDPTLTADSASGASKSSTEDKPHSLTIRIWPNIPILYPMALAALVCGIFSMMFGMESELNRISAVPVPMVEAAADGTVSTVQVTRQNVVPEEFAKKLRNEQVIALVFLAFFTYTLVVVCTDIVLTWALLGVALVTILGMGLFIANIYYGFLSGLFHFLNTFAPHANAHFYFGIFIIWLILMIAAVFYAHFHYVRIESNEVIVVGGVLDKRRRYSTMRMQYTKEIIDVFEYYLPLVRSGRLVLRFPNETEPIVIDHVMNVDSVIKKLDRVSTSLQVSQEDPA